MAHDNSATRQRLHFEDDESREERLGKLFSSISKTETPASPTSAPLPNTGPESKPYAVPESDVLARVRAFLPDFQASTTALMARASLDPDAVNLENVGKGERAIAMDLGLGVYDAPGVDDSVNGHGGGLGPVVNSDSTGLKEEDSDSDSDSDSEEDLDAGEGKAESEDTSSSSELESESGSASDADKASSA